MEMFDLPVWDGAFTPMLQVVTGSCIALEVSLGMCPWAGSCWAGNVCPSRLLPGTGGLCLPQCASALHHL